MRSFSKGLLLMALSLAGSAHAGLQLPAILSDHMVLQQDKPITLWGWDDPKQKVTATLAGSSATGTADKKGKWRLSLPAMKAGGPYEITVAGSVTVTLRDVLVGEVWLGSGQSNMEFPLVDTHDAAKTLPAAKDPSLRLFKQKLLMSDQPLEKARGQWMVCSPEAARNFSAVAYHFGKDLRGELKVPVGLIESCWGGSYVESWIPRSKLKEPAFREVRERWSKRPDWEKRMWAKGSFKADLWLSDLRVTGKKKGLEPFPVPFLAPSAGTPELDPRGVWSTGVKDGSSIKVSVVKGKGHFTGDFLPDAWGWISTPFAQGGKAKDLSEYDAIEFKARGIGRYILFVSEPSIGDWDNYRTEAFEVEKEWKRFRIPFSDLKQSGWGKARPLTKEALSNLFFGLDPRPLPEVPSNLFNAMIHPYLNFPIRGVLWYQGEANTVRPSEYGGLLTALIESWRKAWDDPQMPFLYAQLPLFMQAKPEPSESAWAEVREQQRLIRSVPHTAMAVLMDLGEAGDIHPKNKTEVGKRMALAALGTVYDRKGDFLSPDFQSLTREGGKLRVRFDRLGKGLKVKGPGLKGFAVAGKDGKYQWAQAKLEGDSVLAWSEKVPEPVLLRYDWADNPDGTLYGKNDLPVSPFQANLESPSKK